LIRSGGAVVELFTTAPLQAWNPDAHIVATHVRHRQFTLPVVLVNSRAISPLPEDAGAPIALGRVHPRWLRVTRADAAVVWQAAFHGSPR
jgi:hypothetical protein